MNNTYMNRSCSNACGTCRICPQTKVTVKSTGTLAPGMQATVVNAGTPTNVLLEFGIPLGTVGPKGDTGAVGATGATGANGVNGTNGVNGKDGKDGVNGANGINGINGTNGADGVDGTNGTNGAAASIAVGTTTTLPAGSSATVTNAGTSSAAVFNFGIPLGIPGAGTATLEYSELRGALGNSEELPQLVPSGSKISVKEYRNNVGSFQIVPNATKDYFTISKTGKYLAIFNLCVSATTGTGMFQWGLESQLIKKEMLCTGTATINASNGQHDVSGTDIFTVTDVTERYNLINNSKIQVSVQGVKDSQVVNPNMQYALNGVRDTSGLSFVLVRLGDL